MQLRWDWAWGSAEALESVEWAMHWTPLTWLPMCRIGHETEAQGGGLDVKAQDVGNDWMSEGGGCCAVIKVCGLFPKKEKRGRWDDQEGQT